ncbi:S-layer homology domain-containing protein [Veillonella criceti]|uniref:S-layer homology domain n=1 Tax=Veillonella criceti TaxID=103891 RepID=A0A380NCQ9_9FIRM|nr:S-layer homology domain-containing protein [Veillonella criceti]SUP37077.1 S-layer homology domain [Veillonella criceti]SUP45118.1 S-layer homology domain [Veillonella criceti]
MKKRFAAVFAATAVLGVTTAFAANPFSDVTPNDWAYQSVAQLAAAGVINGYPDGTFKGQNNITRYEMAQMVAKAMANEARANAEQQALINRLADEFSSELNNLGVRVATLENKVGNVKVTGDARLRYKGFEEKGNFEDNKDNSRYNKKSQFDYRGRVQFNATVNENTSAVVRISTGDTEFGDSQDTDVTFDRVYVAHQFGEDTTGVVGRFGAVVGNGLIYDDAFDGAALAYDNGNFQALAGYGSFVKGAFKSLKDINKDGYTNADDNLKVTLLQAKGKLGEHVTLGGFYAFTNDNGELYSNELKLKDDADIYGGSLDLNFDKVWIGGEYATFSEDAANKDYGNDAWVAGIGFGNYNIKEQGTWGVKVQYFDLAEVSPVFSSTWNQPYDNDYKTWMATVDYALANNVGLSAYWAFNGEEQDGTDVGDFYRAELNYKF